MLATRLFFWWDSLFAPPINVVEVDVYFSTVVSREAQF